MRCDNSQKDMPENINSQRNEDVRHTDDVFSNSIQRMVKRDNQLQDVPRTTQPRNLKQICVFLCIIISLYFVVFACYLILSDVDPADQKLFRLRALMILDFWTKSIF